MGRLLAVTYSWTLNVGRGTPRPVNDARSLRAHGNIAGLNALHDKAWQTGVRGDNGSPILLDGLCALGRDVPEVDLIGFNRFEGPRALINERSLHG